MFSTPETFSENARHLSSQARYLKNAVSFLKIDGAETNINRVSGSFMAEDGFGKNETIIEHSGEGRQSVRPLNTLMRLKYSLQAVSRKSIR